MYVKSLLCLWDESEWLTVNLGVTLSEALSDFLFDVCVLKLSYYDHLKTKQKKNETLLEAIIFNWTFFTCYKLFISREREPWSFGTSYCFLVNNFTKRRTHISHLSRIH